AVEGAQGGHVAADDGGFPLLEREKRCTGFCRSLRGSLSVRRRQRNRQQENNADIPHTKLHGHSGKKVKRLCYQPQAAGDSSLRRTAKVRTVAEVNHERNATCRAE